MLKLSTVLSMLMLQLALLVPPAARAADIPIPIHLSESETTIATLRMPDHPRSPRPKRLPVLLVFGGFESAGQVLDLIHTREPVALASFDYPYRAPRKFRFPESLKTLPEAKAMFPKTERGIAELVARLRERPDIDPGKIVLIGASFGAPFALAAAARDPGIAGLVLVHGFGRVPQTLDHVILRSWLPKHGWIARPMAWLAAELGWLYLDLSPPEDFARQLGPGQAALLVTAGRDSFIPREASDSLWQALEASRARTTRIIQDTDHLMPGSDRIIDGIIERVAEWMKANRLSSGGAPGTRVAPSQE